MFKSLITIFVTLVLIGCHGKGYRPAEEILDEGWAKVFVEDSEQQPPLYCYKTLGTPDCYTTPDPKRAKELMSIYPLKKRNFTEKQKLLFSKRVTKISPDIESMRYIPTPQESAYQAKAEAFDDLREEALLAQKNYDTAILKRKKVALKELKEKQIKIIMDNRKTEIVEKNSIIKRSMERVISGITTGHAIQDQLPNKIKNLSITPSSQKRLMPVGTKNSKIKSPLNIK